MHAKRAHRQCKRKRRYFMSIDAAKDTEVMVPNAVFYFKCKKGAARYYLDNNQIRFDEPGQPSIDLGFSTAKTFELLCVNAGLVVSRDQIFEYAWEGRIVTQNSLNQVISQIRDAIGDDKDKAIIRTISRKGYLFSRDYVTAADKMTDPEIIGVDVESTALPIKLPEPSNLEFVNPTSVPWYSKTLYAYLGLSLVSLALWLFNVDFGLLFSDRFVAETQYYDEKPVMYVAFSKPSLSLLKNRMEPWVKEVESMNTHGKTIVINDSLDYYDVYCLLESETPKFVFLSKVVPASRALEVMKECLN